jgi:hypothetical protein
LFGFSKVEDSGDKFECGDGLKDFLGFLKVENLVVKF